MEIIDQLPKQSKHTVLGVIETDDSDTLSVEFDETKETLNIYIPKEAYESRRRTYNMPDATDEEMQGVIVVEHKSRLAGDDHTLESFKEVLTTEGFTVGETIVLVTSPEADEQSEVGVE